MSNLTEHEAFHETLSALQTAKDSLTAAEALFSSSSSDYEASLDEAAQDEKPSKAAISKALDSFLLIKIRERRLALAKAKVSEIEISLDEALHLAAGALVRSLQKWEADHIKSEMDRMINGQSMSAAQVQALEKAVNDSEPVSKCRQLVLALYSPQKGEAGKGALDRAASFLQESVG